MGVILVLGLIGGMVVVSIDAVVPRAKLNKEVRALAAVLQETRSEAVARGAEFYLEYDLDEESYRVVTPYTLNGRLFSLQDREDDRITAREHKLDGTVELATVYVAGEEISSGKAWVRFDPLGTASDHAVVIVQPAYENEYTIEVLALTGLIRFHEGIYNREPPRDADFQ